MKQNKKNELDVDFIGGHAPLTKAEEKAISDYINAKKTGAGRVNPLRKKRTVKNEKSVA